MFVKLTANTHTLITKKVGYIANIATGKQFSFDEEGAIWLSYLESSYIDVEIILQKLMSEYGNVMYNQLKKDYLSFLRILSDENLIELSNENQVINGDIVDKNIYRTYIPSITDLTLEVTNKCNERCVHCYIPNSLKDASTEIDVEITKQIIDEFVNMGGSSVTLTGGEVLLYDSIITLLQYANSKNLKVSIYSNLIALKSEHVQLLKEINVGVIQVSLYGVSEDVHDSITGVKGSCRRTKQSIFKLLENKLPLRIACPVLKENQYEIVNVIKFAREREIQVDLDFNITPRANKNKDNLEHRMNLKELKKCLLNLLDFDREFTIQFLKRHKNVYDSTFNLVDYMNTPICPAGYHGLYITSNGQVTTCPNLQGMPISNIKKESLSEIWHNNKMLNKIRKSLEGTFPKCLKCEARDFCSRCFARNYTETGSPFLQPDYACKMAFLFKKIVEKF